MSLIVAYSALLDRYDQVIPPIWAKSYAMKLCELQHTNQVLHVKAWVLREGIL